MEWFFVFFFVSGFCSILYELVWLRLAAAQFGITNPLVSIVLSMFMAGIGLGSWGAGWAIKKYGHRIKVPLLFYASIELLIGISALVRSLPVAVGTTPAGAIPDCFVFRLLPSFRSVDLPHARAVVRLHGSNYSGGHAGHQSKLPQGRSPVL